MKFPSKEVEVFELAQNIENGLNVYPADFPNIDSMEFANIVSSYTTARNSSDNARSDARTAVAEKSVRLENLIEEMKKVLKQAEVDTVANPAKLAHIGWGSRNEPTPVSVPEPPTKLSALFEGESPVSLQLSWQRPDHDPSKPVVNYIVQRKDRLAGGEWGDWQFCDMTYRTSTALLGQPKGVAMEYRVKATNGAGASIASNTVAVIL